MNANTALLNNINVKNFKIDWQKIFKKTQSLKNLLDAKKHFPTQTETSLLVETVISVLHDFDYHYTFFQVKKILSNPKPISSKEKLIHKISTLLKSNHNLSLDVVFENYKEILENIKLFDNYLTFFDTDQMLLNLTKNVVSNDGFLLSILSKGSNAVDVEFLPLFNVQIINLLTSSNFQFQQLNSQFTKIFTMWYLNQNHTIITPFQYQKALDLMDQKYINLLNKVSREHNYGELFNLVLDALQKYMFALLAKEQILVKLFENNLQMVPDHQSQFLFFIIYYNLDYFHWNKFQRVANLSSTKQHIIRNLNFLVNLKLLKSLILKKRKFYFQTRILKIMLKTAQEYE